MAMEAPPPGAGHAQLFLLGQLDGRAALLDRRNGELVLGFPRSNTLGVLNRAAMGNEFVTR